MNELVASAEMEPKPQRVEDVEKYIIAVPLTEEEEAEVSALVQAANRENKTPGFFWTREKMLLACVLRGIFASKQIYKSTT